MKRHSVLQPLSREHHHFLMVCRNTRWYAEQSARAPDTDTLLLEWRAQLPHLEAHFAQEESALFPFCESLADEGVQQALTRLRAEHAYWRDHAPTALERGDRNALAALGRFLHDHIRYEERFLFPRLQARFTPAQWRMLARGLANSAL